MVNNLTFQKALPVGIRDTSLTLGQFQILDYLRDHDGAVQKEIMAAWGTREGTINSALLTGIRVAPGQKTNLCFSFGIVWMGHRYWSGGISCLTIVECSQMSYNG